MTRLHSIMIIFSCSIILSCFSFNKASAQYTVSGLIVNETGSFISQATITLTQLPSEKTLNKSMSNVTGTFLLNLIDTGKYLLRIEHQSYESYTTLISIKDSATIHRKIVMYTSIKELKGVSIQGRRPLIDQKANKMVLNIENSVSLTGSSVLDAIGKLPGVRVKSGDGIVIIGKGLVNVLIDDRMVYMSGDDLTSFLKSMPASEVSKIEMMTTPPSKYDAAGNSGLINIITKKRKSSGFNGSAFTTFSQAYYLSKNIGTQLNYNKDKWSLNATLALDNNVYNELTNPVTYYPTQRWIQNRKSKSTTKNLLGRISADYQIDKKQLLGISYSYSGRKISSNEYSNTDIFSGNIADSSIIADNIITKNASTHNVNVHYENTLDTTGKKISIDGGYLYFDNNTRQYLNNSTYKKDEYSFSNNSILSSLTPQMGRTYTLQSDVFLPNKFFDFSFGGKLSFINTKTSSDYYSEEKDGSHYNPSLSNAFDYKEDIQALYINGNKKIEKWELNLGFRGEYTQTSGYSGTYGVKNNTDYIKIFPTAFITYNANPNNSFSLSYGKRINRPNYWYLNPFKQYINSYFYYEGNPFLRPSFNNAFQLNYTHKNIFITKIFVNILNNVFDQITIPDEITKISRLTRLNYYSQRTYGIGQSVFFNHLNWLESYNSASIYYIETKSYIDYASGQKGWSGDISSSNSLVLNSGKTLLGSLDFTYTFPQVTGVAHYNAYYSIDAGLKALFLDKKLSVGLNATDIFRTSKIKFSSTTNNIVTFFNNYFDNRAVRLSINYKFGESTGGKKQRKESNSEETRRAN